jgi:hypothetical protein
LVYDKASRGAIAISDGEWEKIEERATKAKKNMKSLKSWKTIKKNILSSK